MAPIFHYSTIGTGVSADVADNIGSRADPPQVEWQAGL